MIIFATYRISYSFKIKFCLFLESDKGKKNLTHQKPRKRGSSASKRGISKEQVCVVVAHDRNGQILSEVAGKGRITALDIDDVLTIK